MTWEGTKRWEEWDVIVRRVRPTSESSLVCDEGEAPGGDPLVFSMGAVTPSGAVPPSPGRILRRASQPWRSKVSFARFC